jgi:SAM-dependent methyltransferase
MGVTPSTTILDVGGLPADWQLLQGLLGFRPRVTILNLGRPSAGDGFPWVIASGLELPFADQSFDIVYSNSVIEHLYNRANQQRFAAEIARVGRSYFVQTPNRWFPIEPHYLTPFIHFFPPHVQLRLLRNFTVWGLMTRPNPELCRRDIDEIQLLDETDMRSLFPNARLIREYFCGLTKSLVAVSANRGLLGSLATVSKNLHEREFVAGSRSAG